MQMSIKYLDELADLLQKEINKSGTTKKSKLFKNIIRSEDKRGGI